MNNKIKQSCLLECCALEYSERLTSMPYTPRGDANNDRSRFLIELSNSYQKPAPVILSL